MQPAEMPVDVNSCIMNVSSFVSVECRVLGLGCSLASLYYFLEEGAVRRRHHHCHHHRLKVCFSKVLVQRWADILVF